MSAPPTAHSHSVAQRCYTLQEWIWSRRPFHTMRDTHIGFAPPLPESPKLSDTIAQAGPTACMLLYAPALVLWPKSKSTTASHVRTAATRSALSGE